MTTQIATMPSEMQQALREFGLMRAFRSLSSTDQLDHTCRVVDATPGDQRREEIGRLLDQLFEDICPRW